MKNIIEELVSKDLVVRINDEEDFNYYRLQDCTVWFKPNGEVYAVEPYAEFSDGSRHYYNRIAGSELEHVELYGEM